MPRWVHLRPWIAIWALSGALSLPTASLSQAVLNAPPPIQSSPDGNGVDPVTGAFSLSTRDLSIGIPSQGGLAYSRSFIGTGWRDNLTGTISSSGTTYTVSFGGGSSSFEFSSGVFSSSQGNGSTLTFDSPSQRYTYTSGSGTVVVFDKAYAETTPLSANEGQITSVTSPNGEVDTYTYKTINLCAVGGGSCANYYRLQSVTNNLGYQLKLAYATNTPSYNTDAPAWQQLAGVTGINNGVDYCTPAADSCGSFSTTWPSTTYSVTSGPPSQSTVTDALSRSIRFTYDSSGRITGVRRASSSSADTTTITYDGSGRVYTLYDGRGTWTYSYVDSGSLRTTTISDPLGHTRTIASSLLTSLITTDTNGDGKVTTYQYDLNGRLLRVILPETNRTAYTYDSRGNITSVTRVAKAGAATIATTATFPTTCANPVTCNEPTATYDAYGKETDYTYDATHGGVTSATLPPATTGGSRPSVTVGYTQLYAWYKNSAGSIVQAPSAVYRPTSRSQCQTTASCAAGADEAKSTTGYGSGSSTVFNNLLPQTSTAGAGDGSLTATTTITYDAVGNLQTVDGPLSGSNDTARYRYDADRELVGIVGPDPDGAGSLKNPAVRLTYNADGQVTLAERGTANSQSDADWASMTILEQSAAAYDAQARRISNSMTTASTIQALTQYSYDDAGRATCVAQRLNRSLFSSPPSSACTAGTAGSDGPDRIVSYAYDAADQLLTTTIASGLTEQSIATVTYTDNGLPQTMQDGMANLTTYEYDGFDHLLKVRFPNPTQGANASSTTDYESYTYDGTGGRLTAVRYRSNDTVGVTYDDLGRVTQKDIPGGTAADVYYGYDLLGRITYAHYGSTGGAGVDYAYDALSRLTSETASSRTMAYQYDLAGERTRITWPDSLYASYDYDLAGRVTAIRENGATSGAGVLARYAYDDLGRRSAISRADGAGAATSYGGYDGADNLSSLSHTFAGSTSYNVTLGYSYNAGSQVVSRTSTNESYTNHPGALSTAYAANGLNQYSSVAGTSYTYDSRGNLASDGVRTFTYDVENRLLSASAPTAVTLTYDPAGRLQTTTASSTTTTFVYSGSDLVAEYGSSGLLRRYIPGPGVDEPVAWYEGAGTADRRWLVQDERGSIIAYANATGAVSGASNTYGYGLYGEPSSWSGPGSASRYRFTGQLTIPEAQLYFYKARVYDPALGRFLQTDPSGEGVNAYAYAGGDPENMIDPTGLSDDPLQFKWVQPDANKYPNWWCDDDGPLAYPSANTEGMGDCTNASLSLGALGHHLPVVGFFGSGSREVDGSGNNDDGKRLLEVGKGILCNMPPPSLGAGFDAYAPLVGPFGPGVSLSGAVSINPKNGQISIGYDNGAGVGFGGGGRIVSGSTVGTGAATKDEILPFIGAGINLNLTAILGPIGAAYTRQLLGTNKGDWGLAYTAGPEISGNANFSFHVQVNLPAIYHLGCGAK